MRLAIFENDALLPCPRLDKDERRLPLIAGTLPIGPYALGTRWSLKSTLQPVQSATCVDPAATKAKICVSPTAILRFLQVLQPLDLPCTPTMAQIGLVSCGAM